MSESSNSQANSPRSASQGADRQLSFEESLERLQATVRRLESGELSLEDSLKCFEEGVRLTRACQEYLGGAERRIELLIRVSAETGPELEPFGNGQ